MTNISINLNGSNVTSLEVKGHSGYANSGSDIVCSALSSAIYVSLGLLDKANINYGLVEDEKTALIKITLNEEQELGFMVMNNLKDALESIACEYKQYITIKYN